MNGKYELLINLIQGYPHLYDKSNKNFKEQRMRENSWQQISEELQMIVKDCQRIWINLRNKYGREKRALPSGSGASVTSQWEYLKLMSFLNAYVKPRNTHTTIPELAKKPTNTILPECVPLLPSPIIIDAASNCLEWLNSSNHLDCSTPDLFMSPHSNEEFEHQAEEKARTANSEAVQLASKGTNRNKRNGSKPNTLKGTLDASKSITEHLKNISRKPKTSADVLGEYIASILKEMTPDEQKIKRRKLLAVLEDD